MKPPSLVVSGGASSMARSSSSASAGGAATRVACATTSGLASPSIAARSCGSRRSVSRSCARSRGLARLARGGRRSLEVEDPLELAPQRPARRVDGRQLVDRIMARADRGDVDERRRDPVAQQRAPPAVRVRSSTESSEPSRRRSRVVSKSSSAWTAARSRRIVPPSARRLERSHVADEAALRLARVAEDGGGGATIGSPGSSRSRRGRPP
jgi:hypothetical protein